jgi:gamma-glutamyltranspeptidase/glutathione hydrolase/leukotriene-C4 hydrolase
VYFCSHQVTDLSACYVVAVTGALSIGVPGEVLGYYRAWSRFGRLPWRRLVQPTIDLCRNGYLVEYALAETIKELESLIRQNSGLRFVELRY